MTPKLEPETELEKHLFPISISPELEELSPEPEIFSGESNSVNIVYPDGSLVPPEENSLAYLLSGRDTPEVKSMKDSYEAKYVHWEIKTDNLHKKKIELEETYKDTEWGNPLLKAYLLIKLKKTNKSYEHARRELKRCWSMF